VRSAHTRPAPAGKETTGGEFLNEVINIVKLGVEKAGGRFQVTKAA